LSSGKSQTLEFQCPKCGKRLRAGLEVAGRRVKCPQCSQPVKVPGVAVVNPTVGKPAEVDDWLSLDAPVLGNASSPAVGPKSNSTPEIASAATNQSGTTSTASEPSEYSLVADPSSAPTASKTVRGNSAPPAAPVGGDASKEGGRNKQKRTESAPDMGTGNGEIRRPSMFDDDLPDLAELDPSTAQKPRVADIFQLEGIDDLIANAPAQSSGFDPVAAVSATASPQFRISCKVCGTPQYVKLDRVGKKTTCSDCHSNFIIPAPPPGWSAEKKKIVIADDGVDVPLAPPEALQSHNTLDSERRAANEYLTNAQKELDDDEIDDLYQGEFDTAGFMQRTFGFVTDPGAISQVILYGAVFAGLFALAQFSKNKIAEGGAEGGGYLLVFFILVAAVSVLVSMPMLSSGLALLESVANRQRRVLEWPGFNLFENFGEVIVILFALAGSLLPGMLVGHLIGRSGGAEWMTLTGMMGTCFLLFPVLLLSMLDNGSVTQPLSGAVFTSIRQVPEAWGAYYLKTSVAFGAVMVSWYMLLGGSATAAAFAGFLVPWLLFFTCQQMGALADAIAEHLSFEFAPATQEDSAKKDAD
jgi:DNA-directed RNA polymerase subunit RPC12/RpoP